MAYRRLLLSALRSSDGDLMPALQHAKKATADALVPLHMVHSAKPPIPFKIDDKYSLTSTIQANQSIVWGIRHTIYPPQVMQNSFFPMQIQQRRTFVQLKTKLTVADNSGAKIVECIKVMNKTRGARLGDTIIASVKQVIGRGKVKKGEVVYCVIVRSRMPKSRCDGSEIRFDDNAVVLVNKQGEPIGTRVMGPVSHELRARKMVKILTLAEYVA